MQHISDSPWAFITVLVIFVVGGLIFFPVLVLITATAAAFGPFTGFILAMAGTLLSASTGFFIGRMLSMNVLRVLIGSSAEKIKQYAHKAGVTGIVALRMMPIAPFSVINLGLGITQMSFPVYLIGTFLGLFPGIIIFAFLGDSFMQLLQNQDERSLLYLGCGMLAWLALIVSSHMLSRRWYMKTHGRKTE